MRPTTFVLRIVAVIVSLGFSFYFVFQLYYIIANPICSEQIYISETKKWECLKYLLFEEAVKRVGERTYDSENYNCVDFSKELVRELEKVNIKSNIAISEDRKHAWIVVWIEATTGKFIPTDKDLGILELRDKDLNVTCKQYGK